MKSVNQNIQDIDACLPQLQCGRCGFDGCAPYATAIASGAAPINRCAPGGQATIEALSVVCKTPVLAPEPQTDQPVVWQQQRAFIHESACIGCTLCLRACPTDAIVGAIQRMHTVIADDCTGCRLCEPVCPTQCIEIVMRADAHQLKAAWDPKDAKDQAKADVGRLRYAAHQDRLSEGKVLAHKKQMRQEIKESLQRVKQKRLKAAHEKKVQSDEQNPHT